MQEFKQELSNCWHRLDNKMLFFPLLATWCLFFHFLGNSTFGYFDTPSLLKWMYNTYTVPETDDGHGLLIPFAVLFLFWWKRKELLTIPQKASWLALVLLGFAVVLHLLGYIVQQPRVSIVAFFIGVYALIGLAWGIRWLWASFFPFVLFAFCVPIGTLEVMKNITLPLRMFSVSIATSILNGFLGFDLIRQGAQIFDATMKHSYDVNAACSGIRSLISLFVVMLIYGVTTFNSPGKRIAIVLVSIPLAVVGNVLRLLSIIIATEMFGREAGTIAHEWSGFFTYLLALICALSIGKIWREPDSEPRPSNSGLEPGAA